MPPRKKNKKDPTGMTVRQKLDLILGSKVIKKLSLQKKDFAKKRPLD